jgi:hypothetical protein
MPAREQQSSEDQLPSLYVQAARFPSERQAGRAYFRVQEALYRRADCDLSAYRLLLNRIPHVTVLGLPPPEELDRTIRKILAAGEPTPLPPEVITTLLERRAEQIRFAPWIERHHRPGQPL